MKQSCYVIVGRPENSTQTTLFKNCLESLQGNTIVCSTNYLNPDFISECSHLYNGLVYSDYNPLCKLHSTEYISTSNFYYERSNHHDHGFAVLNLYWSGIQWGLAHGFTDFVLVNFDTFFYGKDFLSKINQYENFFITDGHSNCETWLMKINLEGVKLLERLLDINVYHNKLAEGKRLEGMVYELISQGRWINNYTEFPREQLTECDVHIDLYKRLDAVIYEGKLMVVINSPIFTHTEIYKEEYTLITENHTYEFGNLYGQWRLLDLGEFRPQNIKMVINGVEYNVFVDEEYVKNSTITFN